MASSSTHSRDRLNAGRARRPSWRDGARDGAWHRRGERPTGRHHSDRGRNTPGAHRARARRPRQRGSRGAATTTRARRATGLQDRTPRPLAHLEDVELRRSSTSTGQPPPLHTAIGDIPPGRAQEPATPPCHQRRRGGPHGPPPGHSEPNEGLPADPDERHTDRATRPGPPGAKTSSLHKTRGDKPEQARGRHGQAAAQPEARRGTGGGEGGDRRARRRCGARDGAREAERQAGRRARGEGRRGRGGGGGRRRASRGARDSRRIGAARGEGVALDVAGGAVAVGLVPERAGVVAVAVEVAAPPPERVHDARMVAADVALGEDELNRPGSCGDSMSWRLGAPGRVFVVECSRLRRARGGAPTFGSAASPAAAREGRTRRRW